MYGAKLRLGAKLSISMPVSQSSVSTIQTNSQIEDCLDLSNISDDVAVEGFLTSSPKHESGYFPEFTPDVTALDFASCKTAVSKTQLQSEFANKS